MKILNVNRKENFFEVIPSGIDDLWQLERIIQPNDIVCGQSERKIKPSREGEKTEKKTIYVEIKVEKVSFHKESQSLRILGEVIFGKPEELVEAKTHHTIEAEIGRKLKVIKENLMDYHIDLLEQAKKASQREKIVAVILDDEEAEIFAVTDYGVEGKASFNAGKQGKQFKTESNEANYFKEITDKLRQMNAKKIIIAGPGFTKDNLAKYIKEKRIEINFALEAINSTGNAGMNELIKSKKIDSIEKELNIKKEIESVEELLLQISKGTGKAEYGLKEVKNAVNAGAAEKLIVLDKLLLEKRTELEELIALAQKTGCKTAIISEKSDAGKQLKGIGGIGAILRYKMQ